MKKILGITILVGFFLMSCSVKDTAEFHQSVLSEPVTISVIHGENRTVYDKSSIEYNELYTTIKKNWWLKDGNGSLSAPDSQMIPLDKPIKILKTLSAKEVATDTMIIFSYDEAIVWDDVYDVENDSKSFNIKTYAFVIPVEYSDDNTKGIMLISEDENIFDQSNVYVYYFNKSIYEKLEPMVGE